MGRDRDQLAFRVAILHQGRNRISDSDHRRSSWGSRCLERLYESDCAPVMVDSARNRLRIDSLVADDSTILGAENA